MVGDGGMDVGRKGQHHERLIISYLSAVIIYNIMYLLDLGKDFCVPYAVMALEGSPPLVLPSKQVVLFNKPGSLPQTQPFIAATFCLSRA